MTLARIKSVLGIALSLAVAGFLHFSLPSRDIVRIVGTDVVREDVRRTDAAGNAVVLTRDVRYIYAKRPNGGDSVYRNEDTGWGWPPYFKFDTADLQARAADMVSTKDDPQWAVIRHYGWRNQWLSIFPNATSIKPIDDPETTLIPWFNIVFLILLAAVLRTIQVRVRRLWQRWTAPDEA